MRRSWRRESRNYETRRLMNRQIIILTPGRTGSSMLAGILDKLGITMALFRDREIGEHAHAPAGLYEDQKFWEINTALWIGRIDEENAAGRYGVEVWRRRDLQLWGVKDPHLCHTLPTLLPLLSEPRLLISTRERNEAVESFRAAFGNTEYRHRVLPDGVEWDVFVERLFDERLALIDEYRNLGLPHLDVPYAKVLENPAGWVGAIAAYCFGGTNLVPFPERVRDAIKHVRPELRHYGPSRKE